MGKKDRIKRSPSHSNAKIPLSIKELQEFVAATSKDDGKELVEDSAEGSLEEVQARARARAFGAIIESCENKNISSILCLIRDLPVVPRPFNAETQARYDEVQRRFDAMSNSELEATNSALRQTQQAAKALIEDATSNAIGIVLTDESVDDSIEVDQEIKLSIKELKEFVDVTSSSVGTNLNEGSAEGSLDEDIVEKFSDCQDSCELVRARRVRDADADLANPIDAAVQDPMGTDLTHNPSNPSWFTEMQARMLAIKSSSEMQARLLSIKSRSSPISDLSLDKSKVAGVQVATSTANPSEPSKFASFLMEVQQAGMTQNAIDQQELGGVRTGFNCKNGLNTEPGVFSVEESQEQFQCPPNGSLSRTPFPEKPNFTDTEPSINGGAFNAFIGPIESTVGSSQSTPHGQRSKATADGVGRHHKWSGHVAAQGDVTVELSGQLGPTSTRDPKAEIEDAMLGRTVGRLLMRDTERSDNQAMAHVSLDTWPANRACVAAVADMPSEPCNAFIMPQRFGSHNLGTHGDSRIEQGTGQHAMGPMDLEMFNADQQPIGPTRASYQPVVSFGNQHGSVQLGPNRADIPSNCPGGLPNLVLDGTASLDIERETDTGIGHRKKFSELFGASPGLANQAADDETQKTTVSNIEFPMGYVSHGPRLENLTLKVPNDLITEGSTDWATTLVGYFIGKGLPYSLVSSTTERLWVNYGLYDTLATDSGVFFFTFSSKEKRDAVLEGGPWYVVGQPLILQPWKPGLRLDKQDVHSIPIWVNLYGIPLELWTPKGISFIASYIGKPLRVDRMTASRRRISYARVCVEISGDLDLIDKFAIETEDGSGHTTLLDIDVEYQWKPSRCPKCSTFGHDCNKKANQMPGYVAQNSKPSQFGYPTAKRDRYNIANDRVWQVVQRKDKGKKPVEGSGLDASPKGSPQRCVGTGRVSSQENQMSDIAEHVVYSIIDSPPLCENRTATVQINNSFTGLIPYVYDRDDPLDNCVGNLPNEGSLEHGETSVTFHEVETETEIGFASPISARQRKREAKRLFSDSRPKGRHRS